MYVSHRRNAKGLRPTDLAASRRHAAAKKVLDAHGVTMTMGVDSLSSCSLVHLHNMHVLLWLAYALPTILTQSADSACLMHTCMLVYTRAHVMVQVLLEYHLHHAVSDSYFDTVLFLATLEGHRCDMYTCIQIIMYMYTTCLLLLCRVL
jgi:hypothetical protein